MKFGSLYVLNSTDRRLHPPSLKLPRVFGWSACRWQVSIN